MSVFFSSGSLHSCIQCELFRSAWSISTYVLRPLSPDSVQLRLYVVCCLYVCLRTGLVCSISAVLDRK